MFGENVITQTTLASMFPISYATMISQFMLPSTPDATVPLAPENVRPLITTAFSLSYSGNLDVGDLNTELTFLARALCAPTKPVSGGFGAVMGSDSLLVSLTFNDVSLDGPLIIQGIILEDSLIFSGTDTSIPSVQVGFCSFNNDLLFTDIPLPSLEIYSCNVGRNITLPSPSSLVFLMLFGQYPQILIPDPKVYPNLTSLLYLNNSNGKQPRDIPKGSIGFGAFTLDGLTQPSYPQILTLALPNPWNYNLAQIFPNLKTLYALGFPDSGDFFSVPNTNCSSLIIIGAPNLQSLDLTNQIGALSEDLIIIGCPRLFGVTLNPDSQSLSTPVSIKNFVIERCGLIYLRGTNAIINAPLKISISDHTSPILTSSSSIKVRLLDYILDALPLIEPSVPAISSDYLPNVISSLADTFPSLILYPVMQTVDYTYLRQTMPVSFTQYNGGTNPVVPFPSNLASATLTNANIFVSPFSLRYTLRVSPGSSFGSSQLSLVSKGIVPSSKKERWILIGVLAGIILLMTIVIIVVVVKRSKLKPPGIPSDGQLHISR